MPYPHKRREKIARDFIAGVDIRTICVYHETSKKQALEIKRQVDKGHYTYLK